MMGDSTGGKKEDITTENAQDIEQIDEIDQDGKVKEIPDEVEIEKDDDDDGSIKREDEDGGEENVCNSNAPADIGDVSEKAEPTGDDEGEVNEDAQEERGDVDNKKRDDKCQLDEDNRENIDQQNEELVDEQNHNSNDNEDDLIDAVSEVNKKAEPLGENEEEVRDEENVGDDKDAEFTDNDDDIGDSISVNGSPRDLGSDKEDDVHTNTDLTAIGKADDKDIESATVGNRRSSMKSAKSSKKTKTVRVRSSKTVSSIEVDMTRIIRNEDDNDSDDDDDDAVTRVTCGKSVDFSMPVDEVDEELQRVIDRPGSGRTSMMDNEDMVGLGRAATMNTPVTINDDRESFIYPRSVQTPSRDGMYQHAVNLIQNRCRSQSYSTRSQPPARRREVRPPPRSAASLPDTIPTTLLGGVPMFNLPNVVKHINKNPFDDQPNSYFYIAQAKPLPMKPMKVWKGYRGNVYFEPMVCRKAQFSSPSANPHPKQSTDSSRLPAIQTSTAEITANRDTNNATESVRFTSHSAATTRSRAPTGRRTAASGTKSAMSTRSTGRQLSILDKTSVLSRMDYNAAEDIKWISGIESTGTLQVGQSGDKLTGRAYKTYRNGEKHPKLRIRRGLVSHKLAGNNKNSPKFGVSGGRINEDLMTNQNANPTNRVQNRTSIQENHSVSHSYPADNYQCVDSMTALQQIMKRNDGHGRSKLVHILPSAYGDSIPGVLRANLAKGK